MRSSHRSRFRIQDGCKYWPLRCVERGGRRRISRNRLAGLEVQDQEEVQGNREKRARKYLGQLEDVDDLV